MRYPPSTVNIARLPQAYVPDNTQQNQLIQQIGARVKTGLDQRKAARLRDELLTPEQKQAALAQESIDIQEEQAHTQVQQKAAQDREFVRQQSRYQEIMSDPEQYSKMMELYDLDPQMAGGLMSVLVSQDEALKAQVAQQAAEANRFYVNYGRMIASDGKEVADKYLRETARNVVRNGGDVSKMAPLLTLSPDEALAQAKVMAGVTGTVFQLKDVQQAFENDMRMRELELKEAQFGNKMRRQDAEFGLDVRSADQRDREISLKEKEAADKASAPSKAELKEQKEQEQKNKTWETYQTAMGALSEALANTETGPIAGRLPAVTDEQQIAEGAQAAMAPVLKQIFRSAGEGVFTDKDQELLMQMVPTRTDNPEAAKSKIENINRIVASKLGIEVEDEQEKPGVSTIGRFTVRRK